MESWKEKLNFKDKVVVAKVVVGAIVMIGVAKVMDQVLENNTSSESAMDKIKIKIGSFVLGFMVAEKAGRYVENAIDFTVEWWNETKKELRNASAESAEK